LGEGFFYSASVLIWFMTIMFRRLLLPFLTLTLAPAAACAVLAVALVDGHEPRWRLLAGTTIVAFLAAGLAFLLAGATARRLSAPLRELIAAVGRLSHGADGTHVLSDPDDEVGRLGVAFNEMSDRLAARVAALEEDRQQLRTILSGMVEGVVALDAEQRVLFANERACQLLEFPTERPVGRRLWEVVRQRPLSDIVRRALERTEPVREELSWSGATHRSLTVHAARLPGPPPRGAVVVIHDTSELRRLERVRQEFVANVSHELKTPLSVIKLCGETLLDGAIDDAVNRGTFLRQIVEQSERLHALILDLISLARIESGVEDYEFQSVAIEPVVAGCLERYRTRAEARGQQLGMDSAADLFVWADEEAIDHILDNLLDNALKYTPEGGTIHVGWSAENAQVQLSVRDTGIGIPEADLPRVFERFYRVDKARSRELGGTGLGLSIVKHLVQAMHGSVRATSRLGVGTTFVVTVPRAAPG
jgi:two-component system, OmpR family, phosphate regulon sensor histidine kinase PhoR